MHMLLLFKYKKRDTLETAHNSQVKLKTNQMTKNMCTSTTLDILVLLLVAFGARICVHVK